MHSFKIKYFLYGILISISLNFIITQASGNDGEFGVYFERMTGICNTDEVITGYSGDSLNFGEKECTPFKDIIGSIFGGGTPPDNSTVIGFDTNGEILYAPNHWKENGGNISYTGNYVGIGTNLPNSKLDIQGGIVNVSNISGNITIGAHDTLKETSISNGTTFFNAGNVGFGKTNPVVPLDVFGDMTVSNTTIVPRIILNGTELKAPPSCFGANQALQWDGANWSCGTLPTIASCGTSTNTCTKGTLGANNPGACGGSATWTCNGSNGGASVNCSNVNPICLTYSWKVSGYGACSLACGPGTQTQTVWCERSDGVTVADTICGGGKPAVSQGCNLGACAVVVPPNTTSCSGRYWHNQQGTQLSYNNSVNFCANIPGGGFRLPTKAEIASCYAADPKLGYGNTSLFTLYLGELSSQYYWTSESDSYTYCNGPCVTRTNKSLLAQAFDLGFPISNVIPGSSDSIPSGMWAGTTSWGSFDGCDPNTAWPGFCTDGVWNASFIGYPVTSVRCIYN